jgi:hypothetical protein
MTDPASGAGAFEARVKQEAARLQGILDERARLGAEEWKQSREGRVLRAILWCKERIENGGWTACACPKCLEGCAAVQLDRFCSEGRAFILANLRKGD